MSIHILHGDIHLIDLQTRMPFKYGIATMTQCPHVFVRLHLEVDGKAVSGIAADHLPPKWFTKVPDKPLDAEVAEMLTVIEHAVTIASGVIADSPFDAWREIYHRQVEWGKSQKLPSLLVQFGTSLVERAMIEAVCLATGMPFWQHVLQAESFGIRLGDIHPILAGKQPRDFGLYRHPPGFLYVRHTIGMADYLTDAEIPPGEWLSDGLPQSLEACIRTYALQQFKVKVSGQLDRDRDRLRRIAAVIEPAARDDFCFSLDGNEHFHSAGEFRDFWQQLIGTPELSEFFRHLLFVEQPLHRDAALDPETGSLNDCVGRYVIIDESDAELDSLPRALELGYHGTSHKNCKGIFKSIANACLLQHRRNKGKPAIMTGEDLSNIGPVALLQDLNVCGALWIESVERNGHQYFAGLSMFPETVQQQILTHHGDLYHASPQGWPTLKIRNGLIDVRSVSDAPFGVGPVIDVEQFPSLAEWRRTHSS